MFRKATQNDFYNCLSIYDSIHELEENKKLQTGWIQGIYPTATTLKNAISRDDLFVIETEGKIAACGIINHEQHEAYGAGYWIFTATPDETMVLHTLVVRPELAGQGIGSSFVKYYEDYARRNGCRVCRFDTNLINSSARKLYNRLGYREAGIVPCDFNGLKDVRLVLFEKSIEPCKA